MDLAADRCLACLLFLIEPDSRAGGEVAAAKLALDTADAAFQRCTAGRAIKIKVCGPDPDGLLVLREGRGGAGSQQLTGTRLTGAVLGLRGAIGPATYEVFAGGPLREPAGFHSPGSVAGFSLAASF